MSLVCVVGCGILAVNGPLGQPTAAWAQESERGSRPEGESREDRRERGRNRNGGGDRGRDGGGGRPGGDEARRDDRSGGTNPASASPSSTNSKPTSSGAAASMNMTDYAKSLVKQHDKNGDFMLQPEERKELRGRAAEADLNKDGVITIDELVAHLSSSSPAPSTSASLPSSLPPANGSGSASEVDRAKGDAEVAKRVFTGSAGGLASSTKEGDKRRSYRFTPASERLPTGLPGWFKSKDANGDGQVLMSEYSRSWSKSTVAEYRRYVLNDDGVITPKEAAKQPK
jgi:hypothetical protein